MAKGNVDILIRLKDKAAERVEALVQRFERGRGPVKRLGEAGRKALTLIERHGANATRVMAGLGAASVWAGKKLNAGFHRSLTWGIGKLKTYAKWAGLAALAFASWQIGAGVRFNATLEQISITLGVLYRSAARANEQMAKTLEFSVVTPFHFEELADTVRMLKAFNLDPDMWLTTVGDVAAGVGRRIQEVARAMNYLSGGRTGEAAEALARMGVNLRLIAGLKWDKQGSLLTPLREALPIVKAFLEARYGGMMKRQARTFSGATSTFLDKIAVLRAEMTRPLFEKMRARLNAFNDSWDRIAKTPAVVRVVEALQNKLVGLWAWLEKIGGKFYSTFTQTGSIGAGLAAGMGAAWEDIRPAAVKFMGWLAKALAKTLKLAWDAFWEQSFGMKLFLGGMAGLMLAPKLAALLSLLGSGGKLGGLLSGARGLGGSLLGRMTGRGGAGILPGHPFWTPMNRMLPAPGARASWICGCTT